ncbi:hypothetical protein SBA2_200003 [Acidobacteriia bacterium SbA2]|nr:hypothetical protein SBA2_200003 [Acidobacteriia bacterium SbA2]
MYVAGILTVNYRFMYMEYGITEGGNIIRLS